MAAIPWLFCFALLLSPAQDVKPPPPLVSKVKLDEVRKLYRDELAARTSESFTKLLRDAKETPTATPDGLELQFAILDLVRNGAAEVGLCELAFEAIDAIDRTFEVNAIAMKSATVADARKKRRTPEQTQDLIVQILELCKQYFEKTFTTGNKGFLEAAASLAKNVESDARAAKLGPAAEQASAFARYAKEMNVEGPLPPFPLARYRYFILGLRGQEVFDAFASQGEPKLRSLASLLKTEPTMPEQHLALSDAFHDAAQESARLPWEQSRLYANSLDHAKRVLATATGAARTRYERDPKLQKRIADLEKRVEATPSIGINLLRRIDPKVDGLSGDWKLEKSILVTPIGSNSRLQLPYEPPAEYDLDMTVVLGQTVNHILIHLPVGGRACTVVVGQDVIGMEYVAGKDWTANRKSVPNLINLGARNAIRYSVRQNGITILVNDKKAFEWAGDPMQLSVLPTWRMANTNTIGIINHSVAYEVHGLTVRPMGNVTGKFLR